VLVKPGALEAVGALADGLVADPEAVARHYVPSSDAVLVYADITPPEGLEPPPPPADDLPPPDHHRRPAPAGPPPPARSRRRRGVGSGAG
jgi:hypothetical protein